MVIFMPNNEKDPADNGAVLNITHVVMAVMSSSVEAEIKAFFLNSQQAIQGLC